MLIKGGDRFADDYDLQIRKGLVHVSGVARVAILKFHVVCAT